MQRSGSTVIYQISKYIIESENLGKGLGFINDEGFCLPEKYHESNKVYLVKCHEYIKDWAKMIEKGLAKGIYSHRDLRDVYTSLYRMHGKSTRNPNIAHLQYFMNNDIAWMNTKGLLTFKYENDLYNILFVVKQIIKYLGIHLNNEKISFLCNEYSIDTQHRKIRNFDFQKYGKSAKSTVYDPESLLHKGHINRSSKEELAPLDRAIIENTCYEWLMERGYSIHSSRVLRYQAFLYELSIRFAKQLESRIYSIKKLLQKQGLFK